MQRSTVYIFCLAAATLGLAACNAGPLLKTGSLTSTEAAAPPLPAGPVDRALHVAATSVRAQKCGFYFDPVALRTNFLAAEAARGTPPEQLAKTGQSYDFTATSISSKITDPEKYCDANRTNTIKTSLQSVIAGNYEPPVKTAAPKSGGLLEFLEGDDTSKTVFNPDHIYDPLLNDKSEKKAEE
jgi:hypothetical protein